jgi:hypothetical protein
MYVSDIRHFLDTADDAPAPARRMAKHLGDVVRAATSGPAGESWLSALTCRRRPGHRSCPGHIAVCRDDVGASIEWLCVSCRDQGVISGWEGCCFDLRPKGPNKVGAQSVPVVIPVDVAATLRTLMFLDTDRERLVFGAIAEDDDVVLDGDEEDLEELIGFVAAEANHESDRRRQKRLDAAFAVLNDAFDSGSSEGSKSEPFGPDHLGKLLYFR